MVGRQPIKTTTSIIRPFTFHRIVVTVDIRLITDRDRAGIRRFNMDRLNPFNMDHLSRFNMDCLRNVDMDRPRIMDKDNIR